MQTEEDVVPIPAITFLMGFVKDRIMNKNKELLPYYEKARDILEYNPETGVVTRFEKCSNLHKETGVVNRGGYKKVSVTLNKQQKILSAHRLAWFMVHGELPNVIDHIDGDKLNNKISNLRSCTHQQNIFNQNKRASNTSGYRGVSWHKGQKKWISNIGYEGKLIYLGCFDCPKKASEVYETKARELHGEFFYAT